MENNNFHKNCLIVDDEIELADMTKEYFELFGVTCDTVADGENCLKKLEDTEYDLMLLDINLQEESGFKLCKTIREKWNMPILFVSARQSDEDVLVALNIGGDDYIKKPYTLSILLAKVKAVLKRSAFMQEAITQESETAQEGALRLRLDEASMKAYIDGREISLKAKEFKLNASLTIEILLSGRKHFLMLFGVIHISAMEHLMFIYENFGRSLKTILMSPSL